MRARAMTDIHTKGREKGSEMSTGKHMPRKQTRLAGIARKTTEAARSRSRLLALVIAVSAVAIVGGLAAASSTANATIDSPRTSTPANVVANKKLILAFLNDVLTNHHGDHAAGYFTRDAQFHAGTIGTITGNANIGGVLNSVVTAIPDLHPALQDIRGEGNEVVVRLVVTGTQTGDLLGIPASGRHLEWDAIDLYQLKGGKISQEWAAEDLTAILNDTGTYKAPWIP
jgi:predicted ester cyclase